MLPHCRVDVVELEAEVVEASKDVGFQRDPRISITVQDGAIFAQDAILGGALLNIFLVSPQMFQEDEPNLTQNFSDGVGSTTNQDKIAC